MVVMLCLPVSIASAIYASSPLVSWVACSLVHGRWPANFLIQLFDFMTCLHQWYITKIFSSQVYFGKPFGPTWEPNASLVPPIIHKQMAKLSATTAVSNESLGFFSYRLAMIRYGLSILVSVSLH